jgi:hypothetical protein
MVPFDKEKPKKVSVNGVRPVHVMSINERASKRVTERGKEGNEALQHIARSKVVYQ